MRLSLLDQSPRGGRQSKGEALEASLARAQSAETAGFRRVWFAEHRRHAAFVGSSPLSLAALALAGTSSIRVGTGGVLLGFNDPRQSAEGFNTLHGLYPGRVDAGVGRANAERSHFDSSLASFMATLEAPAPPLWILGLGQQSAHQATALGAGYAAGHFFAPGPALESLAVRPAGSSNVLAVRVVARDDPEEAQFAAGQFALWRTRRDAGINEPFPETELSLSLPPGIPSSALARNRSAVIAGTPAQVQGQLESLSEQHEIEEVMITMPDTDPARSIHLLESICHEGASHADR